MFNHGTITAMLFLLVGVIYDRAHHRDIDGFGGLASIMPLYTGVTGLRVLRRHGPPGPLGVHLRGAGAARRVAARIPALTVVAASAVVLTAGYMLWTLQRMYLGRAEPEVRDTGCRRSTAASSSRWCRSRAIVLFLGVYPHAILDLQSPALLRSLNEVVRRRRPRRARGARR